MENEDILTKDNSAENTAAKHNADNSYESEEEHLTSLSAFTSGVNYENSTEKYTDNMSSAITFLACGIAGIIVLILNIVGVFNFLSIKGASGIITFVILGGMFIAFILIGIHSLKIANKAKANIANENNLNKEIRTWLSENITASAVDASYDGTGLAEEMKYFNRSEFIKEAVKNEFSDVNDDLIEEITDEYIEEIFNIDYDENSSEYFEEDED